MHRTGVIVAILSVPILGVALVACSGNTATHKSTSSDYRAFSDEFLTLVAKGNQKDLSSVNLDSYWNENKQVMISGAKSACDTLASKSKAEALSDSDLSVATEMDQGYSRRQALVSESALETAAYHHICPQYDTRAGQLLAYLAVQIALED